MTTNKPGSEKDQEIMKFAAKAAGFPEKRLTAFGVIIMEAGYGAEPLYWNPLVDDGDAFRLAVDLRLIIRCYEGTIIVGGEEISVEEHDLSDRHAACRRAITRAAAAIGRAQQ